MNLNDLPTYQENDINKLKDNLNSFCEKYSITKFEVEDIVELLEDGETVEWIIEQLKSENSEIDTDLLSKLLIDIKTIVGPDEDEDEEEDGDIDEDIVEEEQEVSAETPPDLSQIDFSQLDMSQIGDMLPEGMNLPKGVDMKQVQKMMDSPQGKFMADFSMFCQEKGVDMNSAATTNSTQIQELEEEWKSTPRSAFDGQTPSEMLAQNPGLMPQKVETYRREEPRVGRNDPCPCGSGKKYKKCCGR